MLKYATEPLEILYLQKDRISILLLMSGELAEWPKATVC